MKRREFIGVFGGAVTWSLAARGQQLGSRIVGVLGYGSVESQRAGFAPTQRRLAEMGYVEGRNLTIEYRGANSNEDRLAELAKELVERRVDAIVVFSGPSIVAAKAATTSIPILFFTGFDPVQSGFVASLNRPGGNATGISVLNTELLAKRLQVLCELVPSAKSIAVLYSPTTLVSGGTITNQLTSAAETLAVKLSLVEARQADDFEAAFATMANSRSDAVLISADALMFQSQNRATLVRLAARHMLPANYPIREFVAGGGLMSYGTNYPEAYRQVGDYVGRVLNGERPESLPVQQVTKLELVINIRTAKTLGLTVPPTLLGRADEVIE